MDYSEWGGGQDWHPVHDYYGTQTREITTLDSPEIRRVDCKKCRGQGCRNCAQTSERGVVATGYGTGGFGSMGGGNMVCSSSSCPSCMGDGGGRDGGRDGGRGTGGVERFNGSWHGQRDVDKLNDIYKSAFDPRPQSFNGLGTSGERLTLSPMHPQTEQALLPGGTALPRQTLQAVGCTSCSSGKDSFSVGWLGGQPSFLLIALLFVLVAMNIYLLGEYSAIKAFCGTKMSTATNLTG